MAPPAPCGFLAGHQHLCLSPPSFFWTLPYSFSSLTPCTGHSGSGLRSALPLLNLPPHCHPVAKPPHGTAVLWHSCPLTLTTVRRSFPLRQTLGCNVRTSTPAPPRLNPRLLWAGLFPSGCTGAGWILSLCTLWIFCSSSMFCINFDFKK